MYNSTSTIHQGVKANTDAIVLKAKHALHWTGPYKVLANGPCSSAETPEGSPLGDNLLCLDLPSNLPCSGSRRRVAIERCTPCDHPHYSSDMPKIPIGGADVVPMCSTTFSRIPSVPRHSRRCFGSPPTPRGGEDHRTRVGPRTR